LVAWWLGVFWGEEKFPEAVISTQVTPQMPTQYRKTLETVARMM